MNSKERVAAAIAGKPVDKVPLGFYVVDHDIITRVIGRPTLVRNKIAMQLALWEGRRDEVAESLKKDTVEFYRKMPSADIILPKEACLLPPKNYAPSCPKKIADDTWEDSRGRIYKAVWSANEIRCVSQPAAPDREYSAADFEKPLEARPPDPSVFEAIDHVCRELGDERYMPSLSGGVTALTTIGGTEQGLMLYALQPDVVLAANRRQVAWQNQMDRYYIRPGAPGVLMEQDMAGTNAPLISPAMFRDMCLPFLKERIAHVKQSVPQVIFHNCGNNLPLMDMLIEAGIDCYQSLQTTAGMEIGKLKKMHGDRLCFWGGLPVEILLTGTPDDVRRGVRQALERGAPGGRFIFGSSHSIAMNTRYDNFMAMLDEFERLRGNY